MAGGRASRRRQRAGGRGPVQARVCVTPKPGLASLGVYNGICLRPRPERPRLEVQADAGVAPASISCDPSVQVWETSGNVQMCEIFVAKNLPSVQDVPWARGPWRGRSEVSHLGQAPETPSETQSGERREPLGPERPDPVRLPRLRPWELTVSLRRLPLALSQPCLPHLSGEPQVHLCRPPPLFRSCCESCRPQSLIS